MIMISSSSSLLQFLWSTTFLVATVTASSSCSSCVDRGCVYCKGSRIFDNPSVCACGDDWDGGFFGGCNDHSFGGKPLKNKLDCAFDVAQSELLLSFLLVLFLGICCGGIYYCKFTHLQQQSWQQRRQQEQSTSWQPQPPRPTPTETTTPFEEEKEKEEKEEAHPEKAAQRKKKKPTFDMDVDTNKNIEDDKPCNSSSSNWTEEHPNGRPPATNPQHDDQQRKSKQQQQQSNRQPRQRRQTIPTVTAVPVGGGGGGVVASSSNSNNSSSNVVEVPMGSAVPVGGVDGTSSSSSPTNSRNHTGVSSASASVIAKRLEELEAIQHLLTPTEYNTKRAEIISAV